MKWPKMRCFCSKLDVQIVLSYFLLNQNKLHEISIPDQLIDNKNFVSFSYSKSKKLIHQFLELKLPELKILFTKLMGDFNGVLHSSAFVLFTLKSSSFGTDVTFFTEMKLLILILISTNIRKLILRRKFSSFPYAK